jgi:hypothetical protein
MGKLMDFKKLTKEDIRKKSIRGFMQNSANKEYHMEEYADSSGDEDEQRSVENLKRNNIMNDMDVIAPSLDSKSTYRFGTTSNMEGRDQNIFRQKTLSPTANNCGPFQKKLVSVPDSPKNKFFEIPTLPAHQNSKASNNLLAHEKSMQFYDTYNQKSIQKNKEDMSQSHQHGFPFAVTVPKNKKSAQKSTVHSSVRNKAMFHDSLEEKLTKWKGFVEPTAYRGGREERRP